MSAGDIDELMDIWAHSMEGQDIHGPFHSFKDMYAMIDATQCGDAPWKCFSTTYSGPVTENAPSWQLTSYDVWYRNPAVVIANLLENPDFDGQFDYAPYVELDKNGDRHWSDFMSGNFAWRHSVSFPLLLFIPTLKVI